MKTKIVSMLIVVLGFALISALPVTAGVRGSISSEDPCKCITLHVEGKCHREFTGEIEYQLTIANVDCIPENPTGGMFIRGSMQTQGDLYGRFSEDIEICWADVCVDGVCDIVEFLESGGSFELSGSVALTGDGFKMGPRQITPITISGCEPDIPPASCEDGDKPKVQKLRMQYLGGECEIGCEGEVNTQDPGKVECVDWTAGDPPTVFIVSASKDNLSDSKTKRWGEGDVSIGGTFDINAIVGGKDKLDANTYLHVFNFEGGTLLRVLKFHTSCSQDLFVDDEFCIVRVDAIVLE